MSLFKKPKKNIVQRRVFTENDDDDEESMDFQEIHQGSFKPKKKDKEKKPKQTLLSFASEEEEGEVFQVKKSSHNRKVMRMFEKEKKKKDRDKQEKDEPKFKEDKTEVVTDDLVLVVNQNHKKPATPPPPILSGRDALCAGKDEMSSEEEDNSNTVRHRFSKPDNVKKVLEAGAIPDAAMIHAARKKRQRAREMGDFIPVEEEEPEDTGRLVRDDDNEESDDDRIDMEVNLAKRDKDRRREQFFSAQDSDHELDEWEDQQIRKGVTGAAITAAQEMMMDYQVEQQAQTKTIIPPIMDPGVPRTPEMIAEKLKEHFRDACNSREQNLAKLKKIQDDILQATEELEDLKIKAPEAADKFRFYQELRGYITDLVECLDDKISSITDLEQRALTLMGAMSKFVIERRRQDVRDQAHEATGKGIIKMGPEDEEKVRRAAEREGRRSRRRRARESSATPGVTKHVEGMSSDEEMAQQDMLFFDKERKEIQQELEEIFEDVVDDYSSLVNILIRFEHWRSKDPIAYNEAYATFCLPKVASPFVRLKLIFWNPLTETKEIEKMDWYRTLALYGLHDDETESSLSKDPDVTLLPTIVEKVLVPKLTKIVDSCWDPVSSSQTLRLIGCVGRFIRKYPTLSPDSKSLNNLFNSVLHKMKIALDNDIFIPVSPKIADSRNQFFQRQFACGLKLLKNITSWQGIINETKLKELALNSLLNRYLLSALKFCSVTDASQKIRLISQVLPRVWLQDSTPEFKMFTLAIGTLQQQLDKNNPLHLESIDILNGIMKTLRTGSR